MTSSAFSDASPPPRHRWKVLAAGVLANAAFSVVFSGIPMTAVLMRSGYRLDNASLGLALGLMGLGIALSELPWGLLTDRWGDRPVLLLGLACTGAALAAMAVWAAPSEGHVPAFGWLAGGLVLVGLLGGSVNGASGRAVMTWFGDGERGLAMSIRQTAVPLGGAIGAPLLTTLAQHGGFVAVYGVLAALCLGAAGLAALWVHEPPPAPAGRTVPAAATQGRPGPLHDIRAWRMAAGIGILCAPQFAVLSFGSVFLHDFADIGLAGIAAAMSLVQLGAMVLRIWSGGWTDRRGNRPAYLRACCRLTVAMFVLLAACCLGTGAGSAGSAGSVGAGLLMLLAVAGICVSAWHGVAYTELAVMAGAARAGTALGMANTAVFASCFLVPLAIPQLLSAQGWASVWLCAAACALLAMPLLARRAAPRGLACAA
ncbi:MFS transporter [Xylophilus rhododendri]|uniref:MFS transporter n=1 Tax=Xylophilus rhododendri TaxID=2697032 RepID=A0A857J3Q2_9BURK|nr:MFS transporter [Xylophilus rhododendri]QHI97508.1 MFS transporter [Xylophilus rhododendri]